MAKSTGKSNWALHRIGAILNIKIEPWVLEDDRAIINLAAWIRTYHDLGGWHVQFNVVSPETLRDAQEHPERHKGLLVRISGYTVYFNELAREVQDDIISRTSQTSL